MAKRRRKKGDRVGWATLDKWGNICVFATKKQAVEYRNYWECTTEGGLESLCEVRLVEDEREDPE